MHSSSSTEQDELTRLFRQLACPDPGIDGQFARVIAVTHASAVVSQFLARHGEALDRLAPGLVPLLEEWLHRPDFETAWDVVLGDVFRALRDDDEQGVRLGAALGLRVTSVGGLSGDWEMDTPNNAQLRWGDWALPRAHHIRVHGGGEQGRVELSTSSGEKAASFTRSGSGWVGEGAERLPTATIGPVPVALLHGGLIGENLFSQTVANATETVTGDPAASFKAGVQLLERCSPRYAAWVGRVVRNILVVDAEQDKLHSGSSSDYPGLVYLSLPQSPMAVAEMLVHEATHEYYSLASWIGSVQDGSDTELYYSPAVGKPRPLDRILVAYHAFANVALFFDECVTSHPQSKDAFARKRDDLLPKLQTLEAPLRDNPALTPMGAALVEPLADQLAALHD